MSTPSDNTWIHAFICDIPNALDVLKEALGYNKAGNKVRVRRLISLLISPNYFISDYLGLERYLIRGN